MKKGRTMLRGTLIALRPVQVSDLPVLETWLNDEDPDGNFNQFGLSPSHALERSFNETGLLTDQQGRLLIVTPDNTVVGFVSYQVVYGPNSGSRVYNIGIHLAPAYRKKGYGTDAQRLLAGYLFATYPIRRIEAGTDIANSAEQRALEKAGFTREGVLRQAQWRVGEWHDMVVYSKLRGE